MSIIREPHEYVGFAGRQRRDTALHVLEGFLHGIHLDHVINPKEHRELSDWITSHERLGAKDMAFRELLTTLNAAIADGRLEPHEVDDLRELCIRAKSSSEFYEPITHVVQELHGLLHGVVADLELNKAELSGLQDWIDTNAHLRNVWPIGEIESVIVHVLKDGRIDEAEHRTMLHFFAEFANLSFNTTLRGSLPTLLPTDLKINAVCAVDPTLEFATRVFCFTGISSKGTRSLFAEKVAGRGGLFIDIVRQDLDYLIIGDEGNPCWAFACYGRKVAKAVEMRRSGHRLQLVHERDFWDALV